MEVRWTGVACVAVVALVGCTGSAPTQGGPPPPAPVVASATPVVGLSPTPSVAASPAASTLSEQQLLEQALASLTPDRSYPPFIIPLPPIPPGGRRMQAAPTELSGEGPDDTGVDVGAGTWRVAWRASFPPPGDVAVTTCDFEITVFDAAGDVVGSAFVTIDVDEDAGTSFVVPVTLRQTLTVLVGGDCAWQWSVEAQ